jgi:hypothetical protein
MNGCGNGASLFVRAPQGEYKVSQSGYLSIQGGLDSWPIGDVQTSKGLSGLQTALGQKTGLRLGCMGLE